ncbi:MAG TPA: hypothetical protein V6C52_05650 [Coleofasciculaceae cyanobacterium]|jgi:hypothetical protein
MQSITSRPAVPHRLPFGKLRIHEESFQNAKHQRSAKDLRRWLTTLSASVLKEEVNILDLRGIDVLAKVRRDHEWDVLDLKLVRPEAQDFAQQDCSITFKDGKQSEQVTMVDSFSPDLKKTVHPAHAAQEVLVRTLAHSIPYLFGD